ncbi:hypothetical protein FB45DRAFT_787915 [Roridomyces roridus]|uniref:Glucose-methanol-choline oxidoreductase N-terminal domain-containing protein n=1 Tax=Roridomyces roridus TaxID=1738132 RepID=A0AAD7C5I0_9AGAR|nr:hypothetical protein FB45DRAFT_787915 [Roridomyces roridus]
MPFSAQFVGLLFAACVASATTFDYVIVGGGTAGLVVANRLTANPLISVMVLEAGGDGLGNTNISNPANDEKIPGTSIDWAFPTEPLQFAGNRSWGNVPRGKVLGGSSAINGDVWNTGDTREYNEWATLGNPGWNAASIFAAARKAEHFYPPGASSGIDFVTGDHGHSGPLATSFSSDAPPIHSDIIASVVNAGGVKSSDLESGNVVGIAHVTNARLPSNATRSDSATAYYFPYSYRKNFQVTLNVHATKLVWSSTASGNAVASGVEYVDAYGKTHTVSGKKIVLTAGVFGSPPILERSGVGNAAFLKTLGIKSVIDLPGVGENLQEQPIAPLAWVLNSSIPVPTPTAFLLNMESLQTTLMGNSTETLDALLSVKPPGLSDSLYQAHKNLYKAGAPWIEQYITVQPQPTGPSALIWVATLLHQLSRGSVHIASTDGTAFPKINYNLLQSPFDTYALAAGALRIQKILSTPPMSEFILAPAQPLNNFTTLPTLMQAVPEVVTFSSHPAGTTLMGPKADGGVVDSELKLYGSKNVFVVGDSCVPIEPAAHLQATVYALAERFAEMQCA